MSINPIGMGAKPSQGPRVYSAVVDVTTRYTVTVHAKDAAAAKQKLDALRLGVVEGVVLDGKTLLVTDIRSFQEERDQ